MKLSNFKIGTRLRVTLFIVLLFNILITSVAIWNLSNAAKATDVMLEANEKMSLAKDWISETNANAIRAYAKAKSQNLLDEEFLTKEMKVHSEKINEIQKNIERLATTTEEKKSLEVISEARKKYLDTRNKIFNLKEEKGAESVGQVNSLMDSEFVPAMNAYLKAMDSFVNKQSDIFQVTHDETIVMEELAKNIMIGIGIIAFIVTVVLSWVLTKSIIKPLNYAVEVSKIVASGDLTTNIAVESTDETGELLLALKDMNENLANIVSQVRDGTELISNASTEIASGNLELSSRTEQQAASLEETASSMEELTSTVQQNAENAKQAEQLAKTASKISMEGGLVVSKVVETMKDINGSSEKIVEIISVIDGLAFQTNLLALNAAVEAARAGEQGRGFAVVATEVRNLAHRSASAAKEIKQLIGNSVEKIHVGSDLVEQAGRTIAQVVESVKHVTDIMNEISIASQEQASGIEQVNTAIAQMDVVTQQNAALVEEAAAASQTMQDEAVNLAQVVSVFKV